MRFSNLHTHTSFSDGKHSIAETVAAAEELQMLSIGISDHSFTDFDPKFCMKPHRYDAYLQTIAQVGQSSTIAVYAGIEQDCYSPNILDGFDYVIASAHYVYRNGQYYSLDHSQHYQQKCLSEAFGGSVLDMAKCYYDTLCYHVDNLRPTFVGHFDVLTKFSTIPEQDDAYHRIAEDALKQVIGICPYIELNTGAIARGFRKTPYPSEYLLDSLRDLGGKIVLGSDSHQKENLIYYFPEAVQLLREKGFKTIAVFNGKGFDDMPI